MKFLVMIFIDEAQEARYTAEEWARLDKGYEAFARAAAEKGCQFSGGALQPPSKGCTLRVRQGKPLVTDGPFAESKEWIGGFFVLDCPGWDDALALAQLMPGAQSNAVEIRALEPPKADS